MQKLALIFLFAVTFSMINTFNVPALAQETTPETTEGMSEGEVSEEMTDEEPVIEEEVPEEAMDDEVMDEEAMDEEVTDEDLADDSMMPEETMVLTQVISPLAQLTMGVDPHEIECKSGQKLVFKATNWTPACINESSLPILSARGWVAAHDPTHEDLAKMVEDHMAKQPVDETPSEDDSKVDVEEGIEVEEEAIPGTDNSTEPVPEPQSHTVELREDMDMGAS
ncbi:MAG: hypothetical protein LV468_03555 [Candidatus Nitrosotenuis sp.]|jgi:hypothetical protein|nr:hypothetical protein [Candidatus Nitrosotenuis sp.]